MGYRIGDETVEIEARIETSTAKAHLIEPTMGPAQLWLPKSQIVKMDEPHDDDGNRIIVITKWIADKNGL